MNRIEQMLMEGFIKSLRNLLKIMSPKERIELFEKVTEGYCLFCGYKSSVTEPCYCWDDE